MPSPMMCEGVKDGCVGIGVDFIPNDPMLLFLDNSDSPPIVEQ